MFAKRPVSYISVICRMRISTTIHVYKRHIEMRKGMCQPGQQPLTATEKYGEVGRDQNFIVFFCSGYDIILFSENYTGTF